MKNENAHSKTIRVFVIPSSKRNEVKEIRTDHFEVKIKTKPENNAANITLREILAIHFNVSTSNVQILTGRKSRNKTILIK